jgi:hypothetical protein
MIVRETKLKHGTAEQYLALDEAIRTAQFIRNKAVRFWMDNQGTSKADLYSLQPVFVKCVIFLDQDSFLERLSAFRNNTLDMARLYVRI